MMAQVMMLILYLSEHKYYQQPIKMTIDDKQNKKMGAGGFCSLENHEQKLMDVPQ